MSVDLAYRDEGPLEPIVDARVIVLLHAFPLHAGMWGEQVQALRERHRVIAPDLRGFGGSPLDSDAPSLDAMADDVAALLDHLGVRTCVLAGLSLGGYVAMAFLRRHPERVHALALLDTKATSDSQAARENRERIASTVESAASIDVLLTDVLPALTGATTKERNPEVVNALTGMIGSASPAAVAWTQRAMAIRPDSLSDLEIFEAPALIVVGEQDVLSPVAEAELMLDALADAMLAVIPECGHLSAMERPHDVSEILLDFLNDLHEIHQGEGTE